MPRFQHLWRHVIINTRSTWLHGDTRGFRSRKHRIHSSGDYKHRPPPGEHAGLYEYHSARSREEIHIGYAQRALIGRALIQELRSQDYKVIAVAVTKVHAHLLVELPHALPSVKKIIGNAKRTASSAVSQSMPGRIWADGGTYKPVMNRDHNRSAHDYILYDQGPTAWTWSFRDRGVVGQYKRKRRGARKDPERR